MSEVKNSPGMAKASMLCGAISVFIGLTRTLIPAIILGAIAIILGLLSKGSELRLSRDAKWGLTTGGVSFVGNLAVLILLVIVLFTNEDYRKQVDARFKEMYGYSFSDIMEDAEDGSFDLDYFNIPMP